MLPSLPAVTVPQAKFPVLFVSPTVIVDPAPNTLSVTVTTAPADVAVTSLPLPPVHAASAAAKFVAKFVVFVSVMKVAV